MLSLNLPEKAMGKIIAHAFSENGFAPFTNGQWHLDEGKFVKTPQSSGTSVDWTTAGTGVFSGDEKGWVKYDIEGKGPITFYFENPTSGKNTCSVTAPGSLATWASCKIDQGNTAEAVYLLCKPDPFTRCKLSK
ncbi:MAG: hypothetical protein ACTHJ2_00980 [Candidatus Nitrosocosmicus sp.]